LVKRFNIFWRAAVLTIVVFSLGVLLGYTLESGRISEIENEYKQLELERLDITLQTLYYNTMPHLTEEFCSVAIDENLVFADRIYQEGLKLEKYEEANKLTDELIQSKKRYILFKTQFWINSMNLKDRCDADYVNLIYFYKQEPSMTLKAEQNVMGAVLGEIKEEYGSELMLIPLITDFDISAINIAIKQYNITEFPAILINEEIKMEGMQSKEKIIEMINLSNN